MDLTTIITISGLFFGLIVGNAAYFGNSLYVKLAIPSQMERDGFSQATAEGIFVSEINRYTRLGSMISTPSVETSSEPGLPMALAKPLQLQDVVYAIQARIRNYGVVAVDGSLVQEPQGSGLKMYMVVSNPPDPPVAFTLAQPDGNPKPLLAKAAREMMIAIGPFKVALEDFEEGVEGNPAAFERCKQTIATGLAQPWDPRQEGATEDVLLTNLLGMLALRDGNVVEADRQFALSKTFPGANPSAYGVASLNQAFVAIARHQPEEALLHFKEAAAIVTALPEPGIAARVKVLAGLIAWSEGHPDIAEQDFLSAIALSDNDEMPHLYLAELMESHGDTIGADVQRQAGMAARRFDPKFPGLAHTIFKVDPVHGGYKPMF